MKESEFEVPKALTAKKSEFSKWYNQILHLAEIIDKRYDVKGSNVWMNYGYEIMLNIKKYWDVLFKESGIKEMYFPLIVPIKYCKRNLGWWNGFKKQAYWVKSIEDKKSEHVLRPTGEPAMYPMFSLWIRSHRDLPFRIYETVSSFRYETKHTRPIIRDREITVWHEIHTVHATENDAKKEEKEHVKLYDLIWKKCALEPLKLWKPEWEIFPGAVGAIEYYNIMPNGKALENGSINNLGQAYSKKFNIKFKDKDGREKYAWQMCTGNGARLLAAVFGIHGDDRGLVIPPEIAYIQVIIIPIFKPDEKKKVLAKAEKIKTELSERGIRVEIDSRDDLTPGSKFYDWELKGVPIRLELGPRDINNRSAVVVRRDTGEKRNIKESILKVELEKLLENLQENLYNKAKKFNREMIIFADNRSHLEDLLEINKAAKVYWCKSGKCWDSIKSIKEGVELFGTDLKKAKSGKCVICGKQTDIIGYVANTY